ncbi:MAG: hypothetical protein ACT4O2_06035 [Beijerinckiaceae bacterium]
MTKITSSPAIAAALVGCGLAAAPAQAGPNRTFVSGAGTDSGSCNRTAPCRTFSFALTMTNAGGEIDVLDPAAYGQVTITKAISIVNDGAGTAGITASAGNGITINAGASDSVHLHGLTLTGLGSGSNGIQFTSGKSLAIENCVIRNFATGGIVISPTTTSSFSVSNSFASNNGGNGILVSTINGSASVSVTGVLGKVTVNNNGGGIFVSSSPGEINVTIVDSEASNNVNIGIRAATNSVFGVTHPDVMLRNVVASYNGTGLFADDGAILRIAHSVVTGNVTGVSTAGTGSIKSYGDNDIDGNTSDGLAALTTIPPH